MMSITLAVVLCFVAPAVTNLCNAGNDFCGCVATAGEQANCANPTSPGQDVAFAGGFGCQVPGGVIACDNNGLTQGNGAGGFCCTPPPTPAPTPCTAITDFAVTAGLLRCIGDTQGEFIITSTSPAPSVTPVTVIVNNGNPQTGVNVGPVGSATTVVGLHDGNNKVQVISGTGCSFTRNDVSTTGPTAVFLPTTSGAINVSSPFCFGGLGRIRLQPAQGGSGSYVYTRDNFATSQADIVFSGLPGGVTYHFVAKDSTGCTSNTRDVTLNSAPSQLVYTPVGAPPACGPTSNTTAAGGLGSISGAATGGVPGKQYSLDGGPFLSNGGTFTNVPVGTHTVTARDSNGCVIVKSVIVPPTVDLAAPVFTFNPTPLPCAGAFTTLDVNPSPFTYEIDGVAGEPQTVKGTTHTIKVTNGVCSKTFPAIVPLATVPGALCNDNIGGTTTDHCVGDVCTGDCVNSASLCPAGTIGIQVEGGLALCATAVPKNFNAKVELSQWAFYNGGAMPLTEDPATPDRINTDELNTVFKGLFTIGGGPFKFDTQKTVLSLASTNGATILFNKTSCTVTFDALDRKRAPSDAPLFNLITLGGTPDTNVTP